MDKVYGVVIYAKTTGGIEKKLGYDKMFFSKKKAEDYAAKECMNDKLFILKIEEIDVE